MGCLCMLHSFNVHILDIVWSKNKHKEQSDRSPDEVTDTPESDLNNTYAAVVICRIRTSAESWMFL